MSWGRTQSVRRSPEWFGSLSVVPLAEVLRKVAIEERSGDLQIIMGKVIKTIYFDRGFVVFSASNLKRDRLGESLIQLGRINSREFALASALMKTGRRKFGRALVHAGLMSDEELGRHVALQVNRIINSLFSVTDGVYCFDERDCIIPVELMVSLSVYRIILEGTRRMTSGRLIKAGLPSLNTKVAVANRPPFTFDYGKLNAIEQAVLRAAGTGATLRAVALKVAAHRGRVLRACHGLYAAGLLEVKGQARAPLKVQEESGVFLLSDLEKKFARIRAANARQEVLMEFDRLGRISETELLGVASEAGAEEIKKAFESRREEWTAKRTLLGYERSLTVKVDKIQARIESAYQNMVGGQRSGGATDPSFAAGLAGRPQPPPGPTLEMRSPVLASAKPAGQPRLVASPNPFGAAEQAPGKRLGEAPPGETTTDPNPASPPVRVAPPLSDREKQEKVAELLRGVKRCFSEKDWEGAASLLFEIVELAPARADYRGMLGMAMFRSAIMRKNAERHFIEALRLEPQNADLHYALGQYYRSFGMEERAITEFRATLRIHPRHEQARKHLQSLERGRPASFSGGAPGN
jgi:hypothetical protein